MSTAIPDFLAKSKRDQQRIGSAGADRLLNAGRQWDLAPTLRSGGSLVFPHATIDVCGHHIAAAVHACLDSGTNRVVALGVLHTRTPELAEARARAAAGGDPSSEPTCGVQGPGWPGRDDWRSEFSLSHFQFLWNREVERRGLAGPELVVCYPFLAGGHPDRMPGMEALAAKCRDAVVVATMDPFHHGIGYGDSVDSALPPEGGGLALARTEIERGFGLLNGTRPADNPGGNHRPAQLTGESSPAVRDSGNPYAAFEQHCIRTKSDGRDVGQALRWLLGPLDAAVLDLIADDMAPVYQKPSPTWVACALVALSSQK